MVDINNYQKEIAALRARNDELVAENEYLKSLFAEPYERYPSEFRLSPKESKLLSYLRSARGVCSLYQCQDAIGCSHTKSKIVEVYIFWLRKKLSPHGIEIKNVWGIGYMIDAENRGKLNKIILANTSLQTRYSIERSWNANS